ncbi:MAG: hypothetical protein LCH85_00225 [Chloroflexi bacterium]|nr:hypothetical protein [Chloroflexota bacterium]
MHGYNRIDVEVCLHSDFCERFANLFPFSGSSRLFFAQNQHWSCYFVKEGQGFLFPGETTTGALIFLCLEEQASRMSVGMTLQLFVAGTPCGHATILHIVNPDLFKPIISYPQYLTLDQVQQHPALLPSQRSWVEAALAKQAQDYGLRLYHEHINDLCKDYTSPSIFNTLTRVADEAYSIEQRHWLDLYRSRYRHSSAQQTILQDKIAGLRETGGYLLLRGSTGSEAGTLIANLIDPNNPDLYYFLAPQIHQLGARKILRTLIAQLTLKYGLPMNWNSDSDYHRLRATFKKLLYMLAQKGFEATIYIAGLEHLSAEDWSLFLPIVPSGFVFVLGMAADTSYSGINQLQINEYRLPNQAQPTQVSLGAINQVEQPTPLTTTCLAILAVCQSPISRTMLETLLNVDSQTIDSVISMINDLLWQPADHTLIWLDPSIRTAILASFDAPILKQADQQVATWCSDQLTAQASVVEQAQLAYARTHYATHLGQSEQWSRLWQILDTDVYPKAQRQFDHSNNLVINQLIWGQVGILATTLTTEQKIQSLPQLWRYSLLRISLLEDSTPDHSAMVGCLLELGAEQVVLDWIQAVRDPLERIRLYEHSLKYQLKTPRTTIFNVMAQAAKSLSEPEHQSSKLRQIVETAIQYAEFTIAWQLIQSIPNNWCRIVGLTKLAANVAQQINLEQAQAYLAEAIAIAQTLQEPISRNGSLEFIGEFAIEQAHSAAIQTILELIDDDGAKAVLFAKQAKLASLQGDLAQAQRLIEQIPIKNSQYEAYLSLIEYYTDQADLTTAHYLFNYVYPHQSTKMLYINRDLAKLAIQQADLVKAQQIAESITDETVADDLCGLIGQAYADKQDYAMAQTINQLIHDQYKQNDLLRYIANIAATYGLYATATAIVQTISIPTAIPFAIIEIAKIAARQGDQAQARELFFKAGSTIEADQGNWDEHTFARIAETAAQCGDIETALTIARMCKQPGFRSNAFEHVVKACEAQQSQTSNSIKFNPASEFELATLQQLWHQCSNSDEFWQLIPQLKRWISLYPWLGQALLATVAVVNRQLNQSLPNDPTDNPSNE